MLFRSRKMIDEIKEIAKGNSHAITDYLVTQMHELSENQQFEEAQKIKEKHDSIVKYQSKTVITTTNDDNLDVFAYDEDENSVYINILRIAKGSVIQGFTIEYQKKLEEEKEELLAFAILELRHRLKSSSKTLIVPFHPDLSLDNVEIIIPQRGDKKKLLDLSMQNVRQYKLDNYQRYYLPYYDISLR